MLALKGFQKMSLPQELLEQLLTGYLDDALTADERARTGCGHKHEGYEKGNAPGCGK